MSVSYYFTVEALRILSHILFFVGALGTPEKRRTMRANSNAVKPKSGKGLSAGLPIRRPKSKLLNASFGLSFRD